MMAKRVKAVIRFDGPALSNHQMEIDDLAPSLLALGEMCREANKVLNGESAAIKVMVRADIEQQCFQLAFELVQNWFDQIATFLDDEPIHDAKNILEWLGIISGGVGGSLWLVYKFLAKYQKDGITINVNASDGSVVYVASDNSTINVPMPVHELAQSETLLKASQKLLRPVGKDGIDSVEFVDINDGNKTAAKVDGKEARDILDLPSSWIVDAENHAELKSNIRTKVRIKKAVFEGDGMWTIIYRKAVDAKVLDTEWLDEIQNEGIPISSKMLLDVDLVETVPVDENGLANGSPKYEITKVHSVSRAPQQVSLFASILGKGDEEE